MLLSCGSPHSPWKIRASALKFIEKLAQRITMKRKSSCPSEFREFLISYVKERESSCFTSHRTKGICYRPFISIILPRKCFDSSNETLPRLPFTVEPFAFFHLLISLPPDFFNCRSESRFLFNTLSLRRCIVSPN